MRQSGGANETRGPIFFDFLEDLPAAIPQKYRGPRRGAPEAAWDRRSFARNEQRGGRTTEDGTPQLTAVLYRLSSVLRRQNGSSTSSTCCP
jgi:hypothetical protein